MSRNRGLQVTDTKPNTIEVRALVSSADAGKNFDLRCQVREGLLDFLRVCYPESLLQVRIMWQRLEETPAAEAGHVAVVAGERHERGPSAPGLKSKKA